MSNEKKTTNILVGELAGQTLGPGLVVLPGQGNTLAIETDAGVVVLDASGPRHADAMIATLREHTQAPVHAIVYSHGHHGYNAAVDVWQRHNAERGDAPPRLVAHENVTKRYARYRETERLQLRMASMQFPARRPVPLDLLATGFALFDPTETFSDHMTLVEGSRRVELVWAPSEVDDALAVWLPDDGLLCGGAATPGFTIPNIGTPLRTQRYTMRWAETLDRLVRARCNPSNDRVWAADRRRCGGPPDERDVRVPSLAAHRSSRPNESRHVRGRGPGGHDLPRRAIRPALDASDLRRSRVHRARSVPRRKRMVGPQPPPRCILRRPATPPLQSFQPSPTLRPCWIVPAHLPRPAIPNWLCTLLTSLHSLQATIPWCARAGN